MVVSSACVIYTTKNLKEKKKYRIWNEKKNKFGIVSQIV